MFCVKKFNQKICKVEKMAFATRLQTSIVTCLRAFTGVSHTSARSFQMMMKPIPSATITTPIVSSTAETMALPTVPVASLQKLLTPFNALLTQVAGFKVKGRIKRRCKDCYIVIRQQRQYVICSTHPRHKQMAMKQRDYKSWILTHATQSKERGY